MLQIVVKGNYVLVWEANKYILVWKANKYILVWEANKYTLVWEANKYILVLGDQQITLQCMDLKSSTSGYLTNLLRMEDAEESGGGAGGRRA